MARSAMIDETGQDLSSGGKYHEVLEKNHLIGENDTKKQWERNRKRNGRKIFFYSFRSGYGMARNSNFGEERRGWGV